MFDRLKRTLVESFVGAIALGYLFAEVALNFVNVFTAPIAGGVRRNEFPGSTAPAGLSLQAALPQLVSFFVLLPIWYVLLRWLYFTPPKSETSEQAPKAKSFHEKLVSVKSVFSFSSLGSFGFEPSRLCRHPSIRTLI